MNTPTSQVFSLLCHISPFAFIFPKFCLMGCNASFDGNVITNCSLLLQHLTDAQRCYCWVAAAGKVSPRSLPAVAMEATGDKGVMDAIMWHCLNQRGMRTLYETHKLDTSILAPLTGRYCNLQPCSYAGILVASSPQYLAQAKNRTGCIRCGRVEPERFYLNDCFYSTQRPFPPGTAPRIWHPTVNQLLSSCSSRLFHIPATPRKLLEKDLFFHLIPWTLRLWIPPNPHR